MQDVGNTRGKFEFDMRHAASRRHSIRAGPVDGCIQGRCAMLWIRLARVSGNLSVAGWALERLGTTHTLARRHRQLDLEPALALLSHKAHITFVVGPGTRARLIMTLRLVELVAHETVSLGLASHVPLAMAK